MLHDASTTSPLVFPVRYLHDSVVVKVVPGITQLLRSGGSLRVIMQLEHATTKRWQTGELGLGLDRIERPQDSPPQHLQPPMVVLGHASVAGTVVRMEHGPRLHVTDLEALRHPA